MKFVERNTTIPLNKKGFFATVGPEPKGVAIRVFEGEEPIARDNELIGAFCFDRIAGSDAQLEVAIDIDCATNINVSVRNLVESTPVSHLLPYCEPLGDGLRELDNSDDHELSIDSLSEHLGEQ